VAESVLWHGARSCVASDAEWGSAECGVGGVACGVGSTDCRVVVWNAEMIVRSVEWVALSAEWVALSAEWKARSVVRVRCWRGGRRIVEFDGDAERCVAE